MAAGYEAKPKWNDPGSWIWSDSIAHEPLVSVEDFEAAQALQRRLAALPVRLRVGIRQRMSAEEIATMVRNLGDLVAIRSDADPVDKIRVYERLGLHPTYNIGANAVDVEVQT